MKTKSLLKILIAPIGIITLVLMFRFYYWIAPVLGIKGDEGGVTLAVFGCIITIATTIWIIVTEYSNSSHYD